MQLFKFLSLAVFVVLLSSVDSFSQKKTVVISVLIRDEATKKPAPGINVSYFNNRGQLINCDQPTNTQGRLDFEPKDFQPGDKITVIADKPGTYAEKEETLRIVGYGGNENQINFELRPDEGKEVNIKVINDKKQKPVAGAVIRFKNHVGKIEEKVTDENGEARFTIFIKVGREVEFNIQRDGYYSEIKKQTVGEDGIDLLARVEQQNTFTVCDCMPYSTGAFALLSGGMYLSSRKAYSNYKNFKNLNRESDYNKANTRTRVAIVSAGAAGASLVGWLICKSKEKKRENERARRHTGILPKLSPLTSLDYDSNSFQVGFTYKF